MSDSADDTNEIDQDSEPTMTAPLEGRPDGIADPSVAETQSDVSSQDADDQSGSEAPGSP